MRVIKLYFITFVKLKKLELHKWLLTLQKEAVDQALNITIRDLVNWY